MSIIFRPTGGLDISTDPSVLPEESVGKTLLSGAMTRCKNLRLDQQGVLKTRDGSAKFTTSQINGTIDYIIEQGGYRFTFAGNEVYRNETQIAEGIQCETPAFSPGGGSYAATQTVEITTGTRGATIYYTTDGTTPNQTSLVYSSALTVEMPGTLKAIAIKSGFADSVVASAVYLPATFNFLTETDEDRFVTETDSDTFVNEGVA